MPTFLYKGIDTEGYIMSGSKEFKNTAEMEKHLKSIGITQYQIYESKTVYKRGRYALVSPKELSVFCKQMSVLFMSHMTLLEGIQILSAQAENKQIRIALEEVAMYMEGGYTFAEAMSMYDHVFTSYLLNMINIGESSGNLDTVFARMSDYYNKEYKIRKKIRNAVTYPFTLIVLMAAVILLLIIKILPMFGNILSDMGSELPGGTRIILGIGGFLGSYLWIILLVLALLIAVLLVYRRSERGALLYDKLILKLPIARSIIQKVTASRVSRSLAMLIRSGVPLLNAMEEVVPLLNNKYLEGQFKLSIDRLSQGEDFLDAIKRLEIFPPLFIKMVVIGQETGHLDEMLNKCADVFDDETEDAVERFTTMAEPILIIVLSVIVGIILISVMLPMIDIMTLIG